MAPTAKSSSAEEQHEKHIELAAAKGDLTLSEALGLVDDAMRYKKSIRNEWDDFYRVYKGKRVIRNYEGVSDVIVREAHNIIETLVSNIASGNPKFHFVQTNEEQSDDVEVLNGSLDYFMICNQMNLKNQEWVREMLLYGTGILHISWRDGKPWIENIPLRDYFVDPTSTALIQTINPARYSGHEYLADLEDLRGQKIYDAEQEKWVPRYDLEGDIGEYTINNDGADTGKMDKAFKDLFVGSTLGENATKSQAHIIRLYHLPTGRLIEIINRKKIIYNKPTWCQRKRMTRKAWTEVDGVEVQIEQQLDEIKPFLPYAVLRDYIDTSQFYAGGEMELIINDAELLNDYENMDADNNAYQNTPMYWIDPAYADMAPEIETIPGAVYPIPRNAMGALERPQMSNDLDAKKERILARMRRSTAADEAVQGVSQSSSRTTATEVSTQLSQAQLRFSTKVTNLESEGYAQLGIVIYRLMQIFITRATVVRIVGPKGTVFRDYDPWEFNGEWEPHVELDTTIKRREMEVGQRMNQTFEYLKSIQGIDQLELARLVVQSLNPSITDEKFNKLILPPQPPPQRDPFEQINMSYKDAPPFIKAQIEQKMEMKPDPAHFGEMQNTMLEQANRGADLADPTTMADGSLLPGMEDIVSPKPELAPAV